MGTPGPCDCGWPAFLVFDRRGELIYRRAGEGAVTDAEEAIRRALRENRE